VVICRLFTQARSAPTTHSRRPSTLSITGLENFFGLRNFFGLGNFFSFSFSRHPPLYRKSIDVPGSNCTDLLISERVAGFSLKLGRDRPSLPPTVHSQSPVLKIFGLRNFFSFSFSTHPPLYRKSIDVPGSNCTDLFISERVAGSPLKLGRDRPSHLPTVHSQSPVLKFFPILFLSISLIRSNSTKSRLQRHYPVVGDLEKFSPLFFFFFFFFTTLIVAGTAHYSRRLSSHFFTHSNFHSFPFTQLGNFYS